MDEYSFDQKSLLRNGKRWFPVMGEIHYSRYPEKFWKEALLKMKEGGVDIVSSYVIWIHHEEIEGEFDFQGQRNLRKFVETVRECGLSMILRIGPWSHAEVRHGGFPDWLLAKCPDARSSNDEKYFSEVHKFYKKTFEQVEGLLLKDGGPIIGVQIDNEFGHCGGLTGDAGEFHMKKLASMAMEIGFDVPLYTATGWGGAVTAGLLPVMGGYCEAPWDPRITEIEPSGNYVFTYERNDHAIGCDFGLGEGITFDMNKFPYLTAELGGGLQVTKKRRPVAKPKDIGAMSLAKIASGCNLLGYYMYHGGCNPDGKLTTLEENISSGSLNDMSVKNYDFRAPLGEYGRPNGTYDEIKLLSLFLHDFGEHLASTDTFIPESNPIHPENCTDLRVSWRYGKDGSGYVFVNNYQRRQNMKVHEDVVLENNDIGVRFPMIKSINDGEFFFLPFNMHLGNMVLKTSLATPLCILNSNTYIFYTDIEDNEETLYDIEGNDDSIKIITIPRKDALKSHKYFDGKKEHLVITKSTFYCEDGKMVFESTENPAFLAYPELENVPEGFYLSSVINDFYIYKTDLHFSKNPSVDVRKIYSDEKIARYSLKIGSWSANDCFLYVDYTGSSARIFKNGNLMDDGFYIGPDYEWMIGLKRYGKDEQELILEIDVLNDDDEIFLEKWPVLKNHSECVLNVCRTEIQMKV